MKRFSTPLLLSLCALTLLSACGKKNDDSAAVAANPVVTPGDDFNLPEERGQDGQMNIRMIREGMREANEVRLRRGLAPLAVDRDLVAQAQRRARELSRFGNRNGNRNGFGNDNRWQAQDPQHQSAGSDGYPSGFGNPNDQHFRQPVNSFYNYTGENISAGDPVNNAHQMFNIWLNSMQAQTNLLNPNYRRQGIGFANGTWVHLFAN
ncbi:MAG: CAP domain-containing protein [Bdellovibrionota bacterium]